MKESDDLSGFFRENLQLVREYLELRLELLKLQGVRMVSKAFGHLMVFLMVFLLLIFVFFFLGMAFASWIGGITGHPAIGYLCSAGVFLLLMWVAVRFRKPLFQDTMVRTLMDGPEAEKNED